MLSNDNSFVNIFAISAIDFDIVKRSLLLYYVSVVFPLHVTVLWWEIWGQTYSRAPNLWQPILSFCFQSICEEDLDKVLNY